MLPEGTPPGRWSGGHVVVRVPTRHAPPVLQVSDALALTESVEALMVVSRPGRDRRRYARVGRDCRFAIPRRHLGGRVRRYPRFRGAGGFPSVHGPRVTLRPR